MNSHRLEFEGGGLLSRPTSRNRLLKAYFKCSSTTIRMCGVNRAISSNCSAISETNCTPHLWEFCIEAAIVMRLHNAPNVCVFILLNFIHRYYAKPHIMIQKVQNLTVAFKFITEVEKIPLGDISKLNLKM